jgi:hypothetical protein
MGFFGKIDIEYVIEQLKIQSDPKKVESIRALLRNNGLTEEDIDTRLLEVKESGHGGGYKKGSKVSGQMYVLACAHQIRAKRAVGILSKGMIGKTVWCEICNDYREVTSMPFWVK